MALLFAEASGVRTTTMSTCEHSRMNGSLARKTIPSQEWIQAGTVRNLPVEALLISWERFVWLRFWALRPSGLKMEWVIESVDSNP